MHVHLQLVCVCVCVSFTDVAEGFEDEVRGVVSALLESNALELIVQRLTALNEKVSDVLCQKLA